VHRSRVEQFVSALHDRAKAFAIGHPDDQPFMGPVIDAQSVDRAMKYIGIAQREGFEVVMRGKALDTGRPGHYLTPTLCWSADMSLEKTRKSVYQQSELFAPNLAILAVDDLDEAIAQANATQFGLVASVFSKSASVYAHCRDELEMGLVNWNRSTVGASSRLPFGGMKKSGNHFPTAVSASLYCTVPVASLEVGAPKGSTQPFSGLNWKDLN
jgi:succinylglutamic semialdehyde dehydrogenase